MLEECKKEFREIFKMPVLTGVPILVYANKQDLEHAVKIDDFEERLYLAGVSEGREYLIRPSVAIFGTGVEEGTLWLLEHLKPN